jgi:hypothetical protein
LVPAKVPEKVPGGFSIKPGQVQQNSGKIQEKKFGRDFRRFSIESDRIQQASRKKYIKIKFPIFKNIYFFYIFKKKYIII